MKRLMLAAVLALSACGGAPAKQEAIHVNMARPAAFPEIDIPYTKFVLPNGLTLLVHEDRKAPVVAVNVWYHVGSKDEVPGKTGFAHLFEHLMFQGSENLTGEFFEPLERAGATDLNGTTNSDRTNYFETVPKSSLDLALWMESDRMGHFAGAISQERLDEQRGVVQNEKRQGLNQPYGKVWEMIPPNTYPVGHPYSWSTIGSMDDLNAASLDDVKAWFAGYYGAANAVISIAGDISPDEAYAKVLKYFGDIPSGPAVERKGVWIAKMTERRETEVFDRVPQERVMYVYNVPEFGSDALEHLRLTASVMGSGKNSRLYKRLVYEDQIATSVNFYVDENEIGSQLLIMADAKPGADLATLENAIEEELAKFIANGPTEDELLRARMSYFADRVSRLERVGGFGGKSDLLARNQVYLGDAGAYKRQHEVFRTASAAEVKDTTKAWMSEGVFVIRVRPEPTTKVAASDVDRSKLPDVGDAPDLSLPALERVTLANGMTIVLAQRHDVPVVQMSWIAPAGTSTDVGGKPGTARLAMDLMDEGTQNRGSLELSAELERLGANLSSGAGLDDASVNLSVLSVNLDRGVSLLAEVVTQPAFAPEELERRRSQLLAAIAQEKARPNTMAQRLLGPTLFGAGHPYGMPWTGSGTLKASPTSRVTTSWPITHSSFDPTARR
ncbi:MAG: insulinase family protein [bacterium]